MGRRKQLGRMLGMQEGGGRVRDFKRRGMKKVSGRVGYKIWKSCRKCKFIFCLFGWMFVREYDEKLRLTKEQLKVKVNI